MKEIILTILRTGFSKTKKYKTDDLAKCFYPLGYIFEDCDYGIRAKSNMFWKPENSKNRSELITDIMKLSKFKVTDSNYYHMLNNFNNGDKYGIEVFMDKEINVSMLNLCKKHYENLGYAWDNNWDNNWNNSWDKEVALESYNELLKSVDEKPITIKELIEGKTYKIKIPRCVMTELKNIQETYFDDKENDEEDVFSGTQDSIMNDMLEQHLYDLVNQENICDIWNINIGLLEHFGINDNLDFKEKIIQLQYKIVEDFTENIENIEVYKEVLSYRDIEDIETGEEDEEEMEE